MCCNYNRITSAVEFVGAGSVRANGKGSGPLVRQINRILEALVLVKCANLEWLLGAQVAIPAAQTHEWE